MSEPISVTVAGFEVRWDLDNGQNLWAGIPTLSMWIPSTAAGLMLGMQRMVGTERFCLLLMSGGMDSVSDDWNVISSKPTFEEGMEIMSPIAAAAGWGTWEVVHCDRTLRELTMRSRHSWEGIYQKQLGVCWGSSMIAGKFVGLAPRLFQVPCWAEQTKFSARGDDCDEFEIRPTDRTVGLRLQQLIDEGKATTADLTSALTQLQREVGDRQKAEAELREALTQLRTQEETLHKIDAPIIQVWDGVLTVPLMGFLDSERALRMMQRLLEEIVRVRARYAILDLTGIELVDTHTAEHLVRIIRAAELLGARAVITGIHSAVAQTMVGIGVDLARIHTLRNLQDGLKACMRWLEQDRQNAG